MCEAKAPHYDAVQQQALQQAQAEQQAAGVYQTSSQTSLSGSPAAITSSGSNSAFTNAARGAMFWTSLVATAVPGYVGKNLGVTETKHWNWITEHLILGALPVKSKMGASGDHLGKLRTQLETRNLRMGMVVSVILGEEMKGFGIDVVQFCQHPDWRERLGVTRFEHLQVPDLSANITLQELVELTDRMHAVMAPPDGQQPEAVYVHCKAGRGRSWLVAVCYLIAHRNMTYNDACVLVKRMRPQVDPNASQKRQAQAFEEYLHQYRRASSATLQSASASRGLEQAEQTYIRVLAEAMTMPAGLRRQMMHELSASLVNDVSKG
jgi:hypothetical protein